MEKRLLGVFYSIHWKTSSSVFHDPLPPYAILILELEVTFIVQWNAICDEKTKKLSTPNLFPAAQWDQIHQKVPGFKNFKLFCTFKSTNNFSCQLSL